jgi:hypothetical protein
LVLIAGCASAHDVDDLYGDRPSDDGDGDGTNEVSAAQIKAVGTLMGAANTDECKRQIAASLDGLPDELICTGLYTDIKKKTITSAMRSYAPGYVLWADGSGKGRWIYLPKGKKIDSSDMKNWVFPVGTKVFKEFDADKRLIETRLYEKTSEDSWSFATYIWNETETHATRENAGSDIELSERTYHVPTKRDCSECHQGRAENILGFEAVGMGAPDAQGLTLKKLVDEGLLTKNPKNTTMTIGDDGTGLAEPALGWLHMNCGVSCHNDRPASKAYQTRLRMRLDPDELDGRSPQDFESVTTTVGAPAKVIRWQGLTRIVPGDPENSLLYKLITSRQGKTDQMPPLATWFVDDEHADIVRQWIVRMEPLPDAGTPASADGGDGDEQPVD